MSFLLVTSGVVPVLSITATEAYIPVPHTELVGDKIPVDVT